MSGAYYKFDMINTSASGARSTVAESMNTNKTGRRNAMSSASGATDNAMPYHLAPKRVSSTEIPKRKLDTMPSPLLPAILDLLRDPRMLWRRPLGRRYALPEHLESNVLDMIECTVSSGLNGIVLLTTAHAWHSGLLVDYGVKAYLLMFAVKLWTALNISAWFRSERRYDKAIRNGAQRTRRHIAQEALSRETYRPSELHCAFVMLISAPDLFFNFESFGLAMFVCGLTFCETLFLAIDIPRDYRTALSAGQMPQDEPLSMESKLPSDNKPDVVSDDLGRVYDDPDSVCNDLDSASDDLNSVSDDLDSVSNDLDSVPDDTTPSPPEERVTQLNAAQKSQIEAAVALDTRLRLLNERFKREAEASKDEAAVKAQDENARLSKDKSDMDTAFAHLYDTNQRLEEELAAKQMEIDNSIELMKQANLQLQRTKALLEEQRAQSRSDEIFISQRDLDAAPKEHNHNANSAPLQHLLGLLEVKAQKCDVCELFNLNLSHDKIHGQNVTRLQMLSHARLLLTKNAASIVASNKERSELRKQVDQAKQDRIRLDSTILDLEGDVSAHEATLAQVRADNKTERERQDTVVQHMLMRLQDQDCIIKHQNEKLQGCSTAPSPTSHDLHKQNAPTDRIGDGTGCMKEGKVAVQSLINHDFACERQLVRASNDRYNELHKWHQRQQELNKTLQDRLVSNAEMTKRLGVSVGQLAFEKQGLATRVASLNAALRLAEDKANKANSRVNDLQEDATVKDRTIGELQEKLDSQMTSSLEEIAALNAAHQLDLTQQQAELRLESRVLRDRMHDEMSDEADLTKMRIERVERNYSLLQIAAFDQANELRNIIKRLEEQLATEKVCAADQSALEADKMDAMRTELAALADENDGLSGVKEWDRVEKCDSEDNFESGSDEESQVVDRETSESGEESCTSDSTDCEHVEHEASLLKPEVLEEVAQNEEGSKEIAPDEGENLGKATEPEYGGSESESGSDSSWNLLL